MQKHNKFLIWTIWIATIAFIASGPIFSGAGYGSSKAGNVAKVGNIEISQEKLNMVYSSIYSQYNEKMQGTLDKAKAKEMGLPQQAFQRLATQAKILNFAQESGIIVSDKEVLQRLEHLPIFQKDGAFNKEIYLAYLKAQRLKAKTFEATLKEELTIQKTMALLSVKGLPFEDEVIGAAMNVSDKLAYKVLTQNDVNFVAEDAKVKAFWDMQKERFMTPQMYALSIVWTESKNAEVTESEIKDFFEENSYNYTNAEGKQLSFTEAKAQASNDLKLKKTKKTAQKAYIAFKKGKLTESEKITLAVGDQKLTAAIWDALKEKQVGDILKPKVVADMYATIKVDNVVLPKVKSYAEAKAAATLLYTQQARKEALLALAEETVKNFDLSTATVSDFVKLEENVNLKPLNTQESLQFLQKLFTSSKEKGMISVMDKIVVYTIMEQKIAPIDENQTAFVNQTVNQLKRNTFESNLIKMLDKKYPTESYVGGLTN